MSNVLFSVKNWESDVRDVRIEPCDAAEDPLGYRAVFYLSEKTLPKSPSVHEICFRIGASLLSQRAKNLDMAGYNAPMTKKAMGMIEKMLNSRTGVTA